MNKNSVILSIISFLIFSINFAWHYFGYKPCFNDYCDFFFPYYIRKKESNRFCPGYKLLIFDYLKEIIQIQKKK